MAQIEFDKAFNIRSMHGTIQRHRDGSKLVVRTNSRTGKMTMLYMKPRQRSTPVSPRELEVRNRFTVISREVARRIAAGDRRPKSLIWAEIKRELKSAEAIYGEQCPAGREACMSPKEPVELPTMHGRPM